MVRGDERFTELMSGSKGGKDEEEVLVVTPEVIMKVTGAKKPIQIPKRERVKEEDEEEEGDPLDFIDIMRRLITRRE